MASQFRHRSVEEYRAKFNDMKNKATIAADRGDQAGNRTYSTLAKGWEQMIEHARRYGRVGTNSVE